MVKRAAPASSAANEKVAWSASAARYVSPLRRE
jgi:hypothetical protein